MAFIQRLFTTKMCFVAGTLVMTQGGLKPIETIRAGEVVWSRNEVTQAEGWQPVVDTFTTHPEMLHTLRVDADEDGVADAETLTCTGEHPFWVVEENAFVPAAELRPGWHLLRAHGSGQVTVLGIESTRAPPEQPFTTYNFEVATDHTYFVGQSGVWVHNEGKDCTKIFSMFHRAARSLGGVDNLKARRLDVLADVRRQSRLTGEKIAHASWQKSANDVSYKMLADFDSGGFDRIDDFPTVARWDAEFYLKPPGFRPSVDTPPPGMLYRGDFDLHHIAPKELMNALKARQVIPAGFDLDMVPGLVMKRGDHQEMNKALNPLINSLKQNQNINGSQLVKAVYDYYDNNGQKSQAKVLRAFFDRIGITF